jgi:hypothetical protein
MTTRRFEWKTQGHVSYPTSWPSRRREGCEGYLLSRHYAARFGGLSPGLAGPALRLRARLSLGPGEAGHHADVHDQYGAPLCVLRRIWPAGNAAEPRPRGSCVGSARRLPTAWGSRWGHAWPAGLPSGLPWLPRCWPRCGARCRGAEVAWPPWQPGPGRGVGGPSLGAQRGNPRGSSASAS